VLAAFGLTMRDGQREYFYAELDRRFPGVRPRYESTYGRQYECPSPRAASLTQRFESDCQRLGLAPRIPVWSGDAAAQLGLFES
jgi:hypothetical protein